MSATPNDTVVCPHCDSRLDIEQMNCRIFICGYTETGQLPPHDEAGAARAYADGQFIYGCGKQFEVVSGGAVDVRPNGDRFHTAVRCSGK